jgi:hypothetical protein
MNETIGVGTILTKLSNSFLWLRHDLPTLAKDHGHYTVEASHRHSTKACADNEP